MIMSSVLPEFPGLIESRKLAQGVVALIESDEPPDEQVSSKDWSAWLVVAETVRWRQENKNPHLLHACKALGLDYHRVWRMERRPFVQGMLARCINASLDSAATLASIELHQVTETMAHRARNPKDPQGVAAARWLKSLIDERQEVMAAEAEGEGMEVSRALQTMQSFGLGQVELTETVEKRKRQVKVKPAAE